MKPVKADVTVTTLVRADKDTAFRVFTEEIDLWWRKGPRYRFRLRGGVLKFEPGVGGRLVEVFGDGDDHWEVGKVLAWEPGAKLEFLWRLSNFAKDEATRVEVSFEETRDGTRVVIQHFGLTALRKDHPARHGLGDAPYVTEIGMWWGGLLSDYRLRAAAP